MKKSLNNFIGLPDWSLIMACYVGSSGKPFWTAPVRADYDFLRVHVAFFHPPLQHSSQATSPSRYLHLFCPLDYDFPEDRVIFFFFSFLFISSSPSSGVPDTSQGFNKCLLNWINWVCIARSSLSRLALNGIPTKRGSGTCTWWFRWVVSCPVLCVPERVVREYCATVGSHCIGSLHSF